MLRRTLALSVCLCLILAAAAGSASGHKFVAEKFPAVVESEISASTFENSSNKGHVECALTVVQGTWTESATEVRVHPVYSNCLTQAGGKVEIFTIGCDYLWSAETGAGGHGSLKIACSGTQRIEFKMTLCTVKFGPQTVTTGLTLKNEGTGTSRHFRATLTASPLTYEMSGIACSSYFGNGKDGILTANYVVNGYEDGFGEPGEQIGVWFE